MLLNRVSEEVHEWRDPPGMTPVFAIPDVDIEDFAVTLWKGTAKKMSIVDNGYRRVH